jgi:hypothetical protein
MAEDRPDVHRAAPDWMYPYLAGMIDSTGAINISVTKSSRAPLGYQIQIRVRFWSRFETVLGMVDEVADEHGWSARIERVDGKPGVLLGRRDDIRELLILVEPFIIGRLEQVRLLLDAIIPGLENKAHYDRDTFLELMAAIDAFRDASGDEYQVKYDAAYFADEWDMDPPETG